MQTKEVWPEALLVKWLGASIANVESIRAIELIAQRQYGFVSRQQCRDCGLTDSSIHVRLARGGWQRQLPGVFLLPGIRPSPEGKHFAAQLWGGSGSLLCRWSGAWLMGLDEEIPKIPELYVRTGKTSARVKAFRPQGRSVPAINVRGMRVTRPERTLLDICKVASPTRAGTCMDQALRLGLTSLQRLNAEAKDANGANGLPLFKKLLQGRDHRDGAVRSTFEARTLRILKSINSATVIPDHLVTDGDRRYYLDFAYPDLELGIECQSIRWHLGTEAMKKDMARHRRLTLLGWTVLFVCWDDVILTPDKVRAEIEGAIQARIPQLCS